MTDSVSVAASDQASPVLAQLSHDTISVQEAAAINIAAKIGHLEALQERAVKAAEKQADAMETFVALFASVIGQAYAWCPGETEASPVVNYIRSGTGESFNCDKEAEVD